MREISVGELKAGQVVAEAVRGSGGGTLCPAGFRLTDAAIERLRNAGVDAVQIDPRSAEAVMSADLRIAALDARFDGVTDPILKQLRATMEHRLHALKGA